MNNELDRVSQALRDERILRQQADERAAKATEQAKVWRRRAEERAERIQELEEAKRPLIGRKRPQAAVAPAADQEVAAHVLGRRAFPGIRLAVAMADPTCDPILAMFDAVSFEGAPPADAEAVLVSGPLVDRWSPEHQQAFRDWADAPGRAPLLVRGQLPITTEAVEIPPDLLKSFVPRRPTHPEGDDLLIIEDPLAPEAIKLAAEGRPLTMGAANPSVPEAAMAARRWAYRHFHPRTQAQRLMRLAGVDAPDPTPVVSAVLVSNRPEMVPDQIRAMIDQTYGVVELLVGLHGAAPTAAIEEAIEAAEERMTVAMCSLPESMTLGACLNEVTSMGGGGLVAKIDDDDYYGPAYLEDAVAAFDYSGADIVGKATQFTYVEETDETVLRRPGQEERVMSGTPTGASMVTTRAVWDHVRFPHRPRFVDSIFVRGARAIGAIVYGTSRWEFCYVRRSGGHTWEASTDALLAGAHSVFPGFSTEKVVVADDCSGLPALVGTG